MNGNKELVPTHWTTGWTTVLDTGTWRSTLPVHTWRPAPCFVNCPLGNDIPMWIGLAADEAFHEAWLALVDNNPLPAVIGRVCHHPCQTDCNRKVLEGAVGINSLEQYLGDMALEEGWSFPAAPEGSGKRVAIVGGGPAGLSAAYQLRRRGLEVTIYEAQPELGGVLRYGIPEYRLPKAVLNKEIQRILALGVSVKTFSPVADSAALAALRDEYEAVFVAIGAGRAKMLGHLEEAGALSGHDFLRTLAVCETAPDLGQRVVVVGGGSAAMDVARSSRRLGRTVSLVVLEERDAMLAQEEEVADAIEEGAALFNGAMIDTVEKAADGHLVLRCVRVKLDPDAPPGEFCPIRQQGGDFTLEADSLVVAIGQDPDFSVLGDQVETAGGLVKVDGGLAAGPDLYAGGDVATMDRYVSVAIGDGKKAALSIAAALGVGDDEAPKEYTLAEAVTPEEVNTYYFPEVEPTERDKSPVEERLSDFRESRLGLAFSQAAQEAARCMSCGTCIECDNCFVFCSDMAVAKEPDSELHYSVLKQYCKGCGLCAVECPRGCIIMIQETE